MWLDAADLAETGFAALGNNVMIDDGVRVFGAAYIHVGDHSRVDSGVLLAAGPGNLHIGSNVHIAADSRIFAGAADVLLEDFSGISSGVCIFSATDDYTGVSLTNPTVPEELRNVTIGRVCVGRHVLVGANSVVLPGSVIGEAAAVGALTLVHGKVAPGAVVSGNPMRAVGHRDPAALRILERQVATFRSRCDE